MATDPRTTDVSIASLVSGIIGDLRQLIEQQVTLTKTELKAELNKIQTAVVSMGIGVAFCAIGGVLLVFMFVHMLNYYTEVPLWGCYGIIGGSCALLGGILLLIGRGEAANVELLPPPVTREAVKDNIDWVRRETTTEQPR